MDGYTITGLDRHGSVCVTSALILHAPTTKILCDFGTHHKCTVVIRYFPSRKGWRVLDLRAAHRAFVGSGDRRFWVGHRWFDRTYPSLDAAIMHAVFILNA